MDSAKVTGFGKSWSDLASSADGRRWIASAGHSKPGRESGLYWSIPTTQPGAQGAITGAAGTEIELQYAGDGQFRITRARGGSKSTAR